MKQLYDSAYKYALRLTRNREDAEDMAQEAMLRSLRYEDKTKALLRKIIKNLFLSQLRTGRTFVELPEDLVFHTNPEAVIELKDLLPHLNEELKLAALGHDYEQISLMRNVPIGTIKSRVSRKRQELINL